MRILKHRKMILIGLAVFAGFAVSMWISHNTAAHTASHRDPIQRDSDSDQNYFVKATTSARTLAGYVILPPSGSPSQTRTNALGRGEAEVELLDIEISSENPSKVEASAEARAPGDVEVSRPPTICKTLKRYKVTVDGVTEWKNSPEEGMIGVVAAADADGSGGYYHFARAESDADSYEISSSDSHGGREVGIPRFSAHHHKIAIAPRR